jgi:hypothetical protein
MPASGRAGRRSGRSRAPRSDLPARRHADARAQARMPPRVDRSPCLPGIASVGVVLASHVIPDRDALVLLGPGGRLAVVGPPEFASSDLAVGRRVFAQAGGARKSYRPRLGWWLRLQNTKSAGPAQLLGAADEPDELATPLADCDPYSRHRSGSPGVWPIVAASCIAAARRRRSHLCLGRVRRPATSLGW